MSFFKKEKNKKEFENIKEVLGYIDSLEKKIDNLSQELDGLKKDSRFFVQKIGAVRYNPFSGTGGDQSFSVAFLDAYNNGVVITSIYSNEGNRVYAKPIEKGESTYSLSEEEKEAIKRAIGSLNPKS